MKRLLAMFLAFGLVILLTSCEKDKKPENDVDSNDIDIIDVNDDADDDNGNTGDFDVDGGDTGDCGSLDTTWMTPEDSWTLWGYLKMMGEVGEYDGEYVPAVFTDGKIKLSETTTELTEGSFMNYQASVLLADASKYDFINVNQAAGTATVDYWDAMYQFNPALIPALKEAGVREAGFGATVFFRHTFIDVTFDTSGKLTAQYVRKNCFIGLSKTEEVEEEGEVYDVPIGDMYGCFDENVDGSVGEELKMMFKNEFTEDEAAMLEFFNTQQDGSVLQYGQDGYTHLCTCYEADGKTEVNCWNEYDGPGGAEECPAVVEAAGECGTVDPDDDDIIDEDTNDDDPYVDPCTPTNPCVDANKTVCTDTNEDGVAECGCNEGYTLDGGTACINSKNVDCTDNAPENATSTVDQVAVTWNGTAWSTAADCEWTCNNNFEVNETGDGCDPIPVDPCDPNQCLTTDYSTGVCTVDGLTYSCGCNANNTWNAISKTCVPDVKDAVCSNVLTDHAHYTGDNSEGTYVQTWNNSTNEFEPVTFDCTWDCNTNYTNEDGSCVADTRRAPCENIPAHASGIAPNEDGNFEQTWDGDSGTEGEWLPATAECAWNCNVNYTEQGDECVGDTREADCTTVIPENSEYTNEGKFEQTWDGDAEEWLPLPGDFECGWQCAKGFMLNETEDGCVPWMTIYVDINADGLNNGQNWTDAFTSLHSALEVAAAGQEIWIAAGTYKPEACPFYRYETDCLNQKNKHFRLVPDVAILGGFAGGESLASERDPGTNVVVISGDLEGNDGDDIKSDNSYNVFRVDYGIDFTTATIIDGVTISGGYADSIIGGENWNAEGGAIQLRGKSLTIRNSIFADNFAANNGGAISAQEGASLTIEDSHFIDNFTELHDSEGFGTSSGGAISMWKSSVLDISGSLFQGNTSDNGGAFSISDVAVTVTDSTFDSNFAKFRAGAFSIQNSDAPHDLNISGSTFISNSTETTTESSHEGGAINFNNGKVVVSNTEFNANTSVSGVALNLSGTVAGSQIVDSEFLNNVVVFQHSDDSIVQLQGGELTVINSNFTGNTGTALRNHQGNATVESCSFVSNVGSMGVGINNARGNLTVNNSFFENNQASINVESLSRFAGAIANIGVDFETGTFAQGLAARINNTVFVNNAATVWGGAILDVYFPETVYTNCTFYNNNDGSGNAIVHAGAGFSMGDPVPGTVYNNTILWDDIAVLEGDLGGGMVFGPSKISFQSSDVMGSGGSSAWDVSFINSVLGGALTTTNFVDNGGNIDADPVFIGSGDDPLMLASSSPCIDTGNNALVPVEITTDLVGNVRVYNTTVDMGAYEFNPCNPNPCGGATPNCVEDATPQGYTCYPNYNVDWCVVQFPKSIENALVGDKVDIYSRVYIPGITTVTQDAIDLHPLLKVQFGGGLAGVPVSEWSNDAWIDASPNIGYGNDDEYMVLQHTLSMSGNFDYTFRYSVDNGKTWTVCDTEGNMPYDPSKLGHASVNNVMAKWPLDTDFVADGSATAVDSAVEATSFVGGPSIGTITWGTSGAYATGWTTDVSLNTDDYFQVSLKVKDGFGQNVVLNNLIYGEKRSGTGIRNYAIRYSKTSDFSVYTELDNFSVPDDTNTRNNRFDNIGGIQVAPGETIYFRFYGYSAEAEAGTWRMIDLQIGGMYKDI